MSNFEQFEQPQPSFDYDQAADLARQRLELEGASTGEAKQKRSQIKNKIKELYGSNDEPRRQIFNLELEKQKLILELEKDDLSLPEKAKPRIIKYDEYEKNFFMRHPEKNYEIKASFGDLLSDMNWGVYYELGDNVPENLKRKYIDFVYKKQIADLYDQQLIIQRTELEKDQLDEFYLRTYGEVQNNLARGGGESAGLLFEKMVNNLLIKISTDMDKWGLKVERATVIEDVEEKIDFILHLQKKKRGVGFEEVDEIYGKEETLGIQFTLKSAKSEEFRKKQRQVARSLKNLAEIDDLVLVSVPVAHDAIFSKYKKWLHQDKLPGGPENMFKPEEIVAFVKQILQNTELAKDEEFFKNLEIYFKDKK